MTVFYGYIFGLPADWVIFGFIGIVAAIITGIMVYFFTGGEKGPIEEDLALIVPEDEHGTLQTGQLVGKVERGEDTIIVTVPDWQDDEGNEYVTELEITKKVPFPFYDVTKALKRLWIILDRGDLSVVSFTTLLHGLPKRWDLPYADRRKAGKFLVGRYGASSITSLLGSKTGIAVMLGLFLSGGMFGFMMVVLTGHLG